jgi:hypothetical protein
MRICRVKPPKGAPRIAAVKELLRSNDPVLLSWVEALLADSRIATVLLDVHTSILEGSISAIPRRMMVGDDDYSTARRILTDADFRFLSDDI